MWSFIKLSDATDPKYEFLVVSELLPAKHLFVNRITSGDMSKILEIALNTCILYRNIKVLGIRKSKKDCLFGQPPIFLIFS